MKQFKKIGLFIVLIMSILSSCGVKEEELLFDYIPVRMNKDDKKISLIDYDGNLIVEDEFDYTSEIFPTNDVVTEIQSNGKVKYWQIVDKKVKPLIDNEYFHGTPFFEDVAIVSDENDLLSLIDKQGEKLIENLSILGEYQVVRTGVMSNGLIRFKTSDGLWGYVNKSGEVVIKPKYIKCENFTNGMARVINSSNKFGIINKKGEEIFKGNEDISYFPVIDNIMPFRKKNGDEYFFGIIDIKSNDKLIKDSKYSNMQIPYNGFISAAKNDSDWGMIDKKGEVIGDLRFKYSYAPIYSKSGIILAKDDKKVKIFNAKGELIKSFDEYDIIYPIGNNRFLASYKDNSKFDILNKEGEEVSKESYIFSADIEIDWNKSFNIFEQTGVTKNYFGIVSKYFQFEKTFASVFKTISTNEIAGITQNSNIEQILSKFPYKKYVNASNSTNRIDDYSLEFNILNSNEAINESRINNADTDPSAAAAATVDTAAYGMDNSQLTTSSLKDKYPYLSEYSNSYTTYSNLANGLNITYYFYFDQSPKNAITGYDPIFTSQQITVGYDLVRSAKLNTFSIIYELGDVNREIFYANMLKKITTSGWIKKDKNPNFFKDYGYIDFVDPKNNFSLRLDYSNITLSFFKPD